MIRIKLSEILGTKKMTQKALSEETGIRPNTISSLYHEEAKEISFDNLNALCKALKCKINDLLEYIPDENSDEKVVVFIDEDSELTTEQKQQVIDFINKLKSSDS